MKTNSEGMGLLAGQIAEAEAKLESLEHAILEIGEPAAHELRRRLEALKIEEKALKRNYEESQGQESLDTAKMGKIEALLRHIDREEASVEHEADFLHQGAPSTVALAANAGAHLLDVSRRGARRVFGDHPLGMSIFVNHTHQDLVTQYGLVDSDGPSAQSQPRPPQSA